MTNTNEQIAVGRPYIAHKEYGVPQTIKGTLPWSHAVERLEKSHNYWIGTAGTDGKPHSMPVWGVWSRNLVENPRVAVHLESGDDVVILEGVVGRIEASADPRLTRIDDAYEAKYNMRHGIPLWVLRPQTVFAWNRFPDDMTRWKFNSQ